MAYASIVEFTLVIAAFVVVDPAVLDQDILNGTIAEGTWGRWLAACGGWTGWGLPCYLEVGGTVALRTCDASNGLPMGPRQKLWNTRKLSHR